MIRTHEETQCAPTADRIKVEVEVGAVRTRRRCGIAITACEDVEGSDNVEV